MGKEGFFPATAMPDRDWWAALWPDPAGTLYSLGIRSGMTVVDLCCGDGYFTAPLAKIVGGRVYALDIDQQMLERARAEVARQGVFVAEWICADARDVATLIRERVDYVLMANTFHGVPGQTGLARAVAKVLKLGGEFAVVNWHPLPRERTTVLGKPRGPRTETRMSPERVRAVVESAGFRLVQAIELPPYHYGAVFQVLDSLRGRPHGYKEKATRPWDGTVERNCGWNRSCTSSSTINLMARRGQPANPIVLGDAGFLRS